MRSKKICAAVLAAVLAAGSTAAFAAADDENVAVVETAAADDGENTPVTQEEAVTNTEIKPTSVAWVSTSGSWDPTRAGNISYNSSTGVTTFEKFNELKDLTSVTLSGFLGKAPFVVTVDVSSLGITDASNITLEGTNFDDGDPSKTKTGAEAKSVGNLLADGNTMRFYFDAATIEKSNNTTENGGPNWGGKSNWADPVDGVYSRKSPIKITVGNKSVSFDIKVTAPAADAADVVEYGSVTTAYPAGFTDADMVAFAESITDGMTASVNADNEVVVTFAKSKAAIEELVEDEDDPVDPVYLNIATDIPNTVTAGDTTAEAGKFTWVSGYGWDAADHSFNFYNGHIMLWLPATATDDTITITYKVGTGEAQTLNINYEYAFEDTDSTTGITVSAEAGVVPEGTELVVVPGENDPEDEVSFDITLKKGGETVQPAAGKSVTVSIPVPASMAANKDDLKVFYKNGTTYTNMNATLNLAQTALVFDTTHFSTYVVTAKDLAAAAPAPDPDPAPAPAPSGGGTVTFPSSTSSTSTPSGSDSTPSGTTSTDNTSSDGGNNGGNGGGSNANPATGVALGVFPALLAAGAVIVIAKKRK